MIFTPFKHGSKAGAIKAALTGHKSGDSAVNYVMSIHDHEGTQRSVLPLVLKGNPELMKAHLANNNFANQYFSCALTFNEDIEMETVREIAEDFTRMLFPGLEDDQISQLQVLHKDKGKTEVHLIFGKQELSTGKFIHPYMAKRDFKKIDSWQNATNAKYNLNDPKDPRNRQLSNEKQKDLPKTAKDIKSTIHSELEEMFHKGMIKNRDDLINGIRSIDGVTEITRKTSRSISVQAEGHTKNIRLKGAMFEEDFDFNTFANSQLEEEGKAWDTDREARAKRERANADKEYRKQAQYNKQYYKASDKQVLESKLYALVDDNIINGNIGNRKDIVELIKKQDKVVDVVDTHKHHISIYYEGGARPFRMNGEAYKREGDIMKYMETLLENKEISDMELQERRREEEEYYFSNRDGNKIDFVRMKDGKWNEFAKNLQSDEELNRHFNVNYGIIDSEVKSVYEESSTHTLFDLSIFKIFEEENRLDIENKKNNIENNKGIEDGRPEDRKPEYGRTELDKGASSPIIETDSDIIRDRRIIEELNRQSRAEPRYLQQYISKTIEALRTRFTGDDRDSEWSSGGNAGLRAKLESTKRRLPQVYESLEEESAKLVRESEDYNESTRRIAKRSAEISRGYDGLIEESKASRRSSGSALERQVEIFRAKYGYKNHTTTSTPMEKEKLEAVRQKWLDENRKPKLKSLNFDM